MPSSPPIMNAAVEPDSGVSDTHVRFTHDVRHRLRRRAGRMMCGAAMTITALALALSSSSSSLGFDRLSFLQPVAASSVFVGPGGFIVDAPLSIERTDVGSALTQLRARLDELTATVATQSERIAGLDANLTATNAVVNTQQEKIAALTAEVDGINSTVTDISDLVGDTTIVAVVNGLRRLASQLWSDFTALSGLVANQTAELASITSDLTSIESLSGDSTIVTTITSLSSSLTYLTSTVTQIGDLTGGSTLVSTVETIMDSMTDLTANISTLQTLETATSQTLTTLSQTMTSQVTLLTSEIITVETELEAEITQLQLWNRTVNTRIDEVASLTAEEVAALQAWNSTSIAGLTTLQTRATIDANRITVNEEAIEALRTSNQTASKQITAIQTQAVVDEAAIVALQTRATVDEANITSLQSLTHSQGITIAQLTATSEEQGVDIETDAARITLNEEAIAALKMSNQTTFKQIAAIQAQAIIDEAAITALQTRASDDEAAIATLGSWNRTAIALITALQSRATADETNITSLLSRRSAMDNTYLCGTPTQSTAVGGYTLAPSLDSFTTTSAGMVFAMIHCNIGLTQPTPFAASITITSSAGTVAANSDDTDYVMVSSASLAVGSDETISFTATYSNAAVATSTGEYGIICCTGAYIFVPN